MISTDDLVLVTGASGFIGSHVVQQLQEQGYKVRGTVRSLQNEKKVQPLYNLCPSASHKLQLVEADLLKAESWTKAVAGCQAVIHVASPFPAEDPKDEMELIQPAVEGTLSVLRAAQEAKVRRVVLTSSVAAVSGLGENERTYSEADWTDDKTKTSAYIKSKTVAEKAAWDYWKGLDESERFELAVINPVFVMGPALHGSQCTSMVMVQKLLERQMPLLPRLNFNIVDVRDVAEAHIKAMIVPEAAGNRHIASGESCWVKDMAEVLKKEFNSQGYNVPTSVCPTPLLTVAGWFDKTVKMIIPLINIKQHMDTTRMNTVLGVKSRPVQETILDMAYNLIDNGFVKQSSKYKPRS